MSADLNDAKVNTLDLLDAQLDDLKDLPEWKTFPPGVYLVKPVVKMEKKANTGLVISVTCTLLEGGVLEMNDKDATPPEVGSQTSVNYNWDNEYAQGNIKNLLKPIAAATNGQVTKVADLLEMINTADSLKFVMGTREGKAKDGKPAAVFQQFLDILVN